MKELFSKPGKSIRVADKERMIFDFGDGRYYDIAGNSVPPEDSFICEFDSDEAEDVPECDLYKNKGLEEELIPESTTEPVYEIDDYFGNFGYINKAGEYVIEPQYAYAHEFTCGLAAVNLNRTWYKTEDGHRFYENHYGYIDSHGKTVIPFAYDEAQPFNKYGVAVVGTIDDYILIDTAGKTIPGTENLSFDIYYNYNDRFFKFTDKSAESDQEQDPCRNLPIGLYDTKERKVMLPPSIDDAFEHSEDEIHVYEYSSEYGRRDRREHYINSKGDILYPWLINKNFTIINKPNKSRVTIVAISKYYEWSGSISGTFSFNGKNYKSKFMYGIYSPNDNYILPTVYEVIREVDDNLFACLKDGIVSVIKLDPSDY